MDDLTSALMLWIFSNKLGLLESWWLLAAADWRNFKYNKMAMTEAASKLHVAMTIMVPLSFQWNCIGDIYLALLFFKALVLGSLLYEPKPHLVLADGYVMNFGWILTQYFHWAKSWQMIKQGCSSYHLSFLREKLLFVLHDVIRFSWKWKLLLIFYIFIVYVSHVKKWAKTLTVR